MIDEQLAENDRDWSTQSETATQSSAALLNTCLEAHCQPRIEDVLEAQARSADAHQSAPFDVSRLWRELCEGSWKFVHTFSSATRCYAILREQVIPRPPEPRLLTMLALVMTGERRKVLAFDLNLSVSTVSGAVQSCFRSMGLECRHAPTLLIMAVCDIRQTKLPAASWKLAPLEYAGARYFVVSVRRPDLTFPSRLSAAETAVIHELVSGLSYADIAEKRATSVRTVANQIAAAFRKLGVSGRQSLIERLIAHEHQSGSNPRASNHSALKNVPRKAPTRALQASASG